MNYSIMRIMKLNFESVHIFTRFFYDFLYGIVRYAFCIVQRPGNNDAICDTFPIGIVH